MKELNLPPLNIEPMCQKCKKNHKKVFRNSQAMWDNLIATAANKKEKRYYENCKQISWNMCGPFGTCTYKQKADNNENI